jgi:hypothetical protein
MDDKKMKRTTENVIQEISKFLNGAGAAHDWDDFISISISDPRLDAIRIECSDLRDKYPPGTERKYCSDEGLNRLEEILNDLKAGGPVIGGKEQP